MKTATNNLAAAGAFVAVSAGNKDANACQHPPANAAGAMTTAASTSTDTRWSGSNWGGCVEIYAPGKDLYLPDHPSGYRPGSGTSFASPHVAGVAALYKATHGDVGYTVIQDWMRANAAVGKISDNKSPDPALNGVTPNLLLTTGGL
ncbi:S8 family serine peptidase [Nocardia uniformis]|uniref:S8 family serine peptidase n=1 Tax=Nocardia uniformis TaxID=53432 RepID=A0A849CBI2_9NOCA|nr:S8 family serine peptidase [Nocardia uniformis]NNH75068.1 S8 family serine peptidase [Nocardia uniformis]